ncbi:MAG: hypothetical protein AAF226_19855, partial [Verrucomicrobiota bacterium]
LTTKEPDKPLTKTKPSSPTKKNKIEFVKNGVPTFIDLVEWKGAAPLDRTLIPREFHDDLRSDEMNSFTPFLYWYYDIDYLPKGRNDDREDIDRDMKRRLRFDGNYLSSLIEFFEESSAEVGGYDGGGNCPITLERLAKVAEGTTMTFLDVTMMKGGELAYSKELTPLLTASPDGKVLLLDQWWGSVNATIIPAPPEWVKQGVSWQLTNIPKGLIPSVDDGTYELGLTSHPLSVFSVELLPPSP